MHSVVFSFSIQSVQIINGYVILLNIIIFSYIVFLTCFDDLLDLITLYHIAYIDPANSYVIG